MDGIGAKEVVFRRKANFFESVHGGTFDGVETTKFEVIEIWNLDTKERLWIGVTSYSHGFIGAYNHEGRVWFKYDFSIDPSGNFELDQRIALSIMDDRFEAAHKIVPELKAGRYIFKNGEYVLEP